MIVNEKILAYVKEELTEFSVTFIDARKKVLRSKKLPIDGDLLQSFEREITQQAQGEAIQLSIAFLDSGRFIDMRQKTIAHDHYGKNYIEELEKWIEKTGVQKFVDGFLEKRSYKVGPKGYSVLIPSIAWGIAKARAKGKFKRTVWWNKDKTRATFNLVNKLALNLPDVAADTVVEAFAPSSKKSSGTGGGFARKYNKARGR